MNKTTRREYILQLLESKTMYAIQKRNLTKDMAIETIQLAKEMSLLRNNVSMELNLLVKAGLAIKIIGKPVYYFATKPIEKFYNVKFNHNIFKNFFELISFVDKNKDLDNKKNRNFFYEKNVNSDIKSSLRESKLNNKQDIFSALIGFDDDLQVQVKQAKAAMLYPPDGLHLLITGPTGTGKTTFAGIVHQFATEEGCIGKGAPYVIFNCADYAENKQLLLSHLFGHIKGAYTGATTESKGLVDKANGGILFLDEIHRLPPEGQEMLFSLIDRGRYSRLGETEATHKAKILLIGATTENLEDAILQTFLRRIPMVINLLPLNKRPLRVRMQLICLFLREEAKKIGRPLVVEKEVLKVLLLYKCPGNIGQLKNNIRIICANSFIECIMQNKEAPIEIKLSQLIENMDKKFFYFEKNKSEVVRNFNLNDNENIVFNGQEEDMRDNLRNIFFDNNKDDAFYKDILNDVKILIDKGFSIGRIKHDISIDVSNKYKLLLNNNNMKQIEIASKIVTPEVMRIVYEELDKERKFFNGVIDSKMTYSLALHVETMVSRIHQGQNKSYLNIANVMEIYPEEYAIAKKIIKRIETLLNLDVPKEEIDFIGTFLHSIKSIPEEDIIPILVMAHGEATATNMVKVAKSLLSLDNIYSLDMAMDEKIDDVLKKAVNLAKEIDKGKGILLLVDMGSLASFGSFITKKTGILTKTIKMVSTPMVIEAARKGITPGITLDELNDCVQSLSTFIGDRVKLIDNNEKKIDTIDVSIINNYQGKIFKMLENILTFLNVKKSYDLLNCIIKNIETDCKQEFDYILKIKFFFHCACMLERAVRKEPLPYKNVAIEKEKHTKLYTILKKDFVIAEETFGIEIADTELIYIVGLFEPYIIL